MNASADSYYRKVKLFLKLEDASSHANWAGCFLPLNVKHWELLRLTEVPECSVGVQVDGCCWEGMHVKLALVGSCVVLKEEMTCIKYVRKSVKPGRAKQLGVGRQVDPLSVLVQVPLSFKEGSGKKQEVAGGCVGKQAFVRAW